MGKLKEFKEKAVDVVTENRDKIDKGIDKAAEMADRKTGGKHTDKIDETAHSVGGKLDRVTRSEIADNEPATPAPSTPTVSASVPEARDSAVSPEVMWNSSPEATAEPDRPTEQERTKS